MVSHESLEHSLPAETALARAGDPGSTCPSAAPRGSRVWSALRTAVRAVFLAALIAAGLFRANVSGAVRGMEALGELDAQLQSLTLLRSEMQTMPGSGSREGFAADSASRRIHAALTKFQQSGLATAHYRPLTETVLRYTETVLSQVRLARNGLTVEATQLEPRARRQRAELRRLLDATRTRSGSDSQTALALDQSSRGALAVAFVSLAGLGLFRLRSSGPAAGRTGGASAPVGGETPRPVPLGLETGVDSCLVLDGSSVIRTAGASVLRLLGQTQDQILDHTIWEHLHPDDQGKLEELVRKAGIAPDEEWRV
ncbi:MAG: hypothetical protein FJX77_08205, partial [Armatimonadetes bacterium]|nr:hypothetical protein [Armatimonadota bacterium]